MGLTTLRKHNGYGLQGTRRNTSDLRSLTSERGHDTKNLHVELRKRHQPLIKYKSVNLLNHTHNNRMNSEQYSQHFVRYCLACP